MSKLKLVCTVPVPVRCHDRHRSPAQTRQLFFRLALPHRITAGRLRTRAGASVAAEAEAYSILRTAMRGSRRMTKLIHKIVLTLIATGALILGTSFVVWFVEMWARGLL